MYSCELCGNDAHYSYDSPPQVPLVYEPEPCYNHNFDNNFPQTSPSFSQQYLCCTRCRGAHDTFQCQQLIFYELETCYNQNFDDTVSQNSPSFPQQYLCCENCRGPHERFQCQPMNQNYFEPNPSYSSFDQPSKYPIDQSPPQEMKELRQLEHAANVSTHTPEPSRRFSSIYYDDDDDDEESTIPLNEIISQLPQSIAITPFLPTMEPEDSLIIEDEHLHTILEKESDEFIKSSVEELVPIPSESEDLSEDLK
ncbi:hypothetical protein Tco_0894760 [Tanacetum coccineum]|uniref:Uncharacterized protein n=1 Tax=Tanacetum coccineum TaxID=301880 RepID=A0ABQ5CFU6_9ASTR